MRFQDREEAEEALRAVMQGASFQSVAVQIAGVSASNRHAVWFSVDRFPTVVKTVIDGLRVGEVSDVFPHGRKYKLVKLKGKRGGKPMDFSKVQGKLKRIAGREKFQKVLSGYLSQLRQTSKIRIHEKNLEEFEKQYWQGFPDKNAMGDASTGALE
jgi:hypothetical protein